MPCLPEEGRALVYNKSLSCLSVQSRHIFIGEVCDCINHRLQLCWIRQVEDSKREVRYPVQAPLPSFADCHCFPSEAPGTCFKVQSYSSGTICCNGLVHALGFTCGKEDDLRFIHFCTLVWFGF